MWLRLLIVFASGQTLPASRFGKNLNDISAWSAIHPGKGRKEEEGAPAANPGEKTGGTRRHMLGYM
jgi:hypothetical protein